MMWMTGKYEESAVIIGAKSLTYVNKWIDATYVVHSDTRIHTGGSITMGHEMLYKKALVQRLNTKSFTEADLVSVSEYQPYNLWIMDCFNGQGYGIVNNIV